MGDAGEESGPSHHGVVNVDAVQRARNLTRDREEQPAGIDDSAPVLGDAPAHRETPWRKTAEDVREQFIGEIFHCWLAIGDVLWG